jgi:hypothetical protein
VITACGALAIRFGGDDSENAKTGPLVLDILALAPALTTVIILYVAR